jgi:hypothetical protein
MPNTRSIMQIKKQCINWVWWHMAVISALGRQKQEDLKIKDSMGYTRSCLKKTKNSPSMVVNVCNPNYSNGRDQEITV